MKLIVLSIAWMCTSAFSPGYINAVHTHNPKTMTAIRAATDDNIYYINEDRRSLMNLILVSSLATTIGGMAIPYFAFFMPPIAIGGTGLTIAKDKVGKDIVVSEYFQDKKLGDRSLVQGLRGDATYLIVNDEKKSLDPIALNAICTHLGCVVPWSEANNKYMCPCHGSQYDPTGAVVRGPAPLPLELAHVEVTEGKVALTPWTEEDFRTGGKAWWN